MNEHVKPSSIDAAESRQASVVADLLAGITLITTEELATSQRFARPNDAFRRWLRKVGIKPVPGRRGKYDPKHVRERLDAFQGIEDQDRFAETEPPISLTEQRRQRRAKATGNH